jgi:hypothetical protein
MERVVRVQEETDDRVDRWLRVQRDEDCRLLEFYDLALPPSQQRFFKIELDEGLLDAVIALIPVRIHSDDGYCSILCDGANVRIRFQEYSWPFECDWQVTRKDFLAAVSGIT